MCAAVCVAAALLLTLYVWGSLEVARGSSDVPRTSASDPHSAADSPSTSIVLAGNGVQIAVGAVVVGPCGSAPESPPDADEATEMRRVAVYLTVYNVGARAATFTPLDVALRDGRGEVYVAYDPEWSRSPALPGSALEPGGQVEGWRVFEVPAAGLDYSLLYRSDAMDSAVAAGLPRLRTAGDDR